MSPTTDATLTAVDGPFRPGPVSVVLWASWFGLVGGGLELAAFLIKCHYLDPRNYNVSRHFPWMFLAAGLLVFAGPGLVFAAAAWLGRGRLTPRAVLLVLSFLLYLGFLFRWPIYTVACLLLASGLAVRTSALLGARAERFNRVVRKSLVALTVVFVATVVACFSTELLARAPVTASTDARPSGASNVLLIVLDTVRAESLSLYGYDRDTSPNLTRYAARGVRFDRAFSTAPWTAPSHASMFTGRWCHELSVGWNRPLDGSCPTLAGFLAGRGYDTAGFVANTTYCSYETGLARGFARYDDYDVSLRAIFLCSSLVQRVVNFTHKHPALARLVGEDRPTSGHRKSAERINRDFLKWLSCRPARSDRPFFAFLNYYDAHHPYLSPEPDDAGPFGTRPESGDDLRMLRSWWEFDKRKLDRRGVELVRDSYDRCIAYLDGHVGKVLDELDRRGVLSSTLVVITADHGEHLGEQHLFGHGCSLYRPELHVPLLVITPNGGSAGRVVSTPVSLRDLPATVVDVLGIGDRSRSPFPGLSLARTWSGSTEPAPLRELPVLSEVEGPPELDPNHGTSPARLGPMRSLVGWGFHYIRNGDGREELFDLEGDPGERLDLSARRDAAVTLSRFRDYLRR